MHTITVMMSTYNGEKYLEEQINSILDQSLVDVSLVVRDDGSTDGTIDILEKYKTYPNVSVYYGENKGYGKSFLKLLSLSGKSEFYSFSDQDDIWEKNKLHKAIEKLIILPQAKPNLYCSDLKIVSSKGNEIGIKNFKNMNITLESAFIRHRTAGCTYVFNNLLLEEAKKINDINYDNEIHHDAWVYRLCLSLNGNVYYHSDSYIKYRQHNDNVTGVYKGFLKRFNVEISKFLLEKPNNSYAQLINNNYKELLNHENQILFDKIINYKDDIRKKISLIFSSKFDSGVFIFNIKAYFLIIFNRF